MKLLIFAIVSFGVLQINSGEKDCDKQWYRFEYKCFFINATDVSRDENELNCQRMGATMVSIHSQEENDFLVSILTKLRWHWLGAKRIQVGSHLAKWEDGSPYNYTSRFHNRDNIDRAGYDYLQIFSDGDWMFYKEDKVSQICQKMLVDITYDQNTTEFSNDVMKGFEVDETISPNTTLSSNITPQTECDENWARFGNKCFFLNLTEANRDESSQNCAKLNATLPSINSQTENTFITNLIPDSNRYVKFWLGGSRLSAGNSVLKWDDGSSFNFSSHWYVSIFRLPEERSYNSTVIRKNGDWSWVGNTDRAKQICQKHISPPNVDECEPNWYRFQDKCYWISNNEDNHDTNGWKCQEMGATMVSIHSQEENDFISKITVNGTSYWLGAEKSAHDNPDRWDDGTRFDYSKWGSHHLQDEEQHHCMQFINGHWIYYHCSDDAGQLCQKAVSKSSSSSSAQNNEEMNKLINMINDKLDQMNIKVSQMGGKFNSLNSSLTKAIQATKSYQRDTNIMNDAIEKRLRDLSSELSKLLVKNIETNEKCKSGWKQWRNKCYYIDRRYNKYDGTVATCQRMNATPVAIRSAEENEFIRQTYTRLTFWLGGKRVKGTEQWKWPDGSDILYTNWNVGEPNHLHTEECIQYYNNGPHSGFWNDYPCNTERERSLCEIELKITSKEEPKDEINYICDDGWLQFDNKCFLINRTETTRNENENYCKQIGANLASIHTREENNFIVSKMNAKRKYWTGGIRVSNRWNSFKWSDESAWNYSNWNSGEPTNSVQENCVVISNGRFIVDDCASKHSQMCLKVASIVAANDSKAIAFEQLLNMKHEIVGLMGRMHSMQYLKSNDLKHQSSNTTHIYVFAIMFLIIFAIIAYIVTVAYKKRRNLLFDNLLDNDNL